MASASFAIPLLRSDDVVLVRPRAQVRRLRSLGDRLLPVLFEHPQRCRRGVLGGNRFSMAGTDHGPEDRDADGAPRLRLFATVDVRRSPDVRLADRSGRWIL